MSQSMLQEMTHISLRLLSNLFHLHALLYYCALYTVFLRMNKICLNQIHVNHFMINLHKSMGPDWEREFDPGPVPSFVEIDHEMISTVILLPSADSFKKSCCQLQAKYVHELLVNHLLKPAQEKVWLGKLTVPQ